MNIPVDEMLSELKTVLEQLDREPTFANFDRVQKETARLERTCEDAVFAALDVPNDKAVRQAAANTGDKDDE